MLAVSGFAIANPLNDILDVMGFGQDALTGMPIATVKAKKDAEGLTLEFLEKRISELERKIDLLQEQLIECGCSNKEMEGIDILEAGRPEKIENEDPCLEECQEENILCRKEAQQNKCKDFYIKWDECVQEYKPQVNNEKELLEKCALPKKELDTCLNNVCQPNFLKCRKYCETSVPEVTKTCQDEYSKCKEECGNFLGIFQRTPSTACIRDCKNQMSRCLGENEVSEERLPGVGDIPEIRDIPKKLNTPEIANIPEIDDNGEDKGYKSAYWECYNGETEQQGSESSCKTAETWKSYAEEFCQDKCYRDGSKCGVNSFGVEKECDLESDDSSLKTEEEIETEEICKKECEMYNEKCQLNCLEHPDFGFCDENYEICQDECGGDKTCLRDCTLDWDICNEQQKKCISECISEKDICLRNC